MTVFPLGTFIVNILGCFAIGLVLSLSEKYMNLSPSWILFIATGFGVGFTTLSSFSYEKRWSDILFYTSLSSIWLFINLLRDIILLIKKI